MESLAGLLPIILIAVVFWLLIIRPASRRQKALQEVQRQLEVGDYVITGSGFFGTIRSFDDDKVGLEIADGVVMTVARQSIVGVPPQAEVTDGATDEAEAVVDPTADAADRDR